MVHFDFNSEHLQALDESLRDKLDPNEARGKHWQTFAKNLTRVDLSALHEGQLQRKDIFTLAKSNVGVATVCAAIMAWGGMRQNHRDLLFDPKYEGWLSIASNIRYGKLDRAKAYERFAECRELGELKGAGPAYFTKLIYFLMPRPLPATKLGYIMDQWAGCSINLLTGQEIVLMNVQTTWKPNNGDNNPIYSFTVSNVNTSENYEKFCTAVDYLAVLLRKNDCQVDRALFSSGGRHPKSWRKYVIENRTKLVYNGAK